MIDETLLAGADCLNDLELGSNGAAALDRGRQVCDVELERPCETRKRLERATDG
jgi:hypothetical protein